MKKPPEGGFKQHRTIQGYDIRSGGLSISKESDTEINFTDLVANL